jgi:hypothetical protein
MIGALIKQESFWINLFLTNYSYRLNDLKPSAKIINDLFTLSLSHPITLSLSHSLASPDFVQLFNQQFFRLYITVSNHTYQVNTFG